MSSPPWLTPLLDAGRMRATDRWAIDEVGIGSLELMERAGRGLAELANEILGAGEVAVVCGKGNNGGDGLVAARILREAGRPVRVLLTVEPGSLRGDARSNLERLPAPAPVAFSPAALTGACGAVDALLGTGFSGAPHGAVADAVMALNRSGLPVVAADVPSGVDAGTGEVAGEAVRAVATATFHLAKPGLWINPGKAQAGRVVERGIGIPAGAPIADPDVGLIAETVLEMLPRRRPGWTKFDSGVVIVAGGSHGLTGAPSLVSEAATRAGAGYVTACVPASVEALVGLRLLEAMSAPLPEQDGALSPTAVDELLQRAQRAGALALGPGLGSSEGAQIFARGAAARAALPLVLDADGLNAHAGRLNDLSRRKAPTVLTPHAGELGRLLDIPSAEVEGRRLHHVREAARRAGAIVVLKGDDSLVAAPDGTVAVSPGGAPGLATAGTGDVLTGVTAAMLARGVEPFCAVCLAVHLHARAGRLAAERHGAPDGVIASDVIAALPRALAAGRSDPR